MFFNHPCPPQKPPSHPQLHKYALSVFKRISAQISQCVKSAPVRVCMCVSFYSVYQRLRVDVENVCIHVSAISLAGSCHWKRLNSKLSQTKGNERQENGTALAGLILDSV